MAQGCIIAVCTVECYRWLGPLRRGFVVAAAASK